MRDDDERARGAAHRIDARRHELERIDVETRIGLVENRQLGLEQRHLEDFVPLLLAAGEALVDRPAEHALVDVEQRRLRLDERHELHRVELRLAEVLPLGVQRGLKEVGVVDARNLDRILKGHEDPFARARIRIHVEQIAPFETHFPARDVVLGMARQRAGQRALARPVRPHDGVYFAGVHVEIDPLEDFLVLRADLQILDLKHGYPTDPSSETLSSFCASTANSIGSSRKTSLQKPLTIMLTASSAVSPRCRQ